MLRVAAVLLVVLGFGLTVASRGTTASDKPGCEGMGEYRKAMLKVGRDYLKAVEEDGIPVTRDVATYSTDDWNALAENALLFQRNLKSVIPPEYAKAWHQLQIERAGLTEQVAKAVAAGGLLVALGFSDQYDANDLATTLATAEAAEECADFSTFDHDWHALDGYIDGTPVATPTD